MVRKLKDDESKGNDFVEGEVFRGRNICEFVIPFFNNFTCVVISLLDMFRFCIMHILI